MDFEQKLLKSIQSGQAVLFLGAGASLGCKSPVKYEMMTGDKLKKCISDEFLEGACQDEPLMKVADYAKVHVGTSDLQNYLGKIFEEMYPAEWHKIITKFRWKAIFTTNYDLVVERAYQEAQSPLQQVIPIKRNNEYDDKLFSDGQNVPLFKLHGCITDKNDTSLPMILGTGEYARFKNGRDRLFQHLKDKGHNYPIIFAGYDISDSNINYILFDLFDEQISRPSYAVVRPGMHKFQKKQYEKNNFDVFDDTFEAFLTALDDAVPQDLRALTFQNKHGTGLSKILATNDKPSDDLLSAVEYDMTLVHEGMILSQVNGLDFYKGLETAWGVFKQGMDFRRDVVDDIVRYCIHKNAEDRVQVYLIKGYAGSGKTIALKRTAWDMAHDFEKPVFFIEKFFNRLRADAIIELCKLANERIYLCVDNALSHSDELKNLVQIARVKNVELTIITTARTNEWNVESDYLDTTLDVLREFEMGKLSRIEVDKLIDKLKTHVQLEHIQNKTATQLRRYITARTNSQLLVLLHETTSGQPFGQIILDEYNNIPSRQARMLYLDICSVHRFGHIARAGLISRISNIRIERFKEKFFAPLMHVIDVKKDPKSGDYAYAARHEIIANLVFEKALRTQDDKADLLISLLNSLSLDYSEDYSCMTQILRGKELAKNFAEKRLVYEIFATAEEQLDDLGYIYHQKAKYELAHQGSDYNAALSYIQEAEGVKPDSVDIQHTKAEILAGFANSTNSQFEADASRNEAKKIISRYLPKSKTSHMYHCLAKILFDELKETASKMQQDDSYDRVFESILVEIDASMSEGLKKFPDDRYLSAINYDINKFVYGIENSISLIEKLVEKNPRDQHATRRLADAYEKMGRLPEAKMCLEACVAINPNARMAHASIARLYIKDDRLKNKQKISEHLRRSYNAFDNNLQLQFEHAVHLWLTDNKEEANKIFGYIKRSKLTPHEKNKLRYKVSDTDGCPTTYRGSIVEKAYSNFCFIRAVEIPTPLFAHASKFLDDALFESVNEYDAVRFRLGFSMIGPVACEVDLL